MKYSSKIFLSFVSLTESSSWSKKMRPNSDASYCWKENLNKSGKIYLKKFGLIYGLLLLKRREKSLQSQNTVATFFSLSVFTFSSCASLNLRFSDSCFCFYSSVSMGWPSIYFCPGCSVSLESSARLPGGSLNTGLKSDFCGCMICSNWIWRTRQRNSFVMKSAQIKLFIQQVLPKLRRPLYWIGCCCKLSQFCYGVGASFSQSLSCIYFSIFSLLNVQLTLLSYRLSTYRQSDTSQCDLYLSTAAYPSSRSFAFMGKSTF